jgi:hypothetical protein
MDDFIWALRRSDCCDLFCRRTFSSSRVCARRSFGKDDPIMGSIPQRMGIGGSTPEITEALNYVADKLLLAGTALVLASALPRDPDRVEKT